MKDNKPKTEKQPWFGPKRYGYGIAPRTWQGWLFIAIGVVIYVAITIGTRHLWPDWFIAKTNGVGWNPVTWQGYVIIFAPPVVILFVLMLIYLKQRKG